MCCLRHVQVLNSLLRRKRLLATDKKHLSLLDPFVQHLVDSIESKHIQVSDRRQLCVVRLISQLVEHEWLDV